METQTLQIKLDNVTLDVTGTYYRGGWGSFEEMPVANTFEIDNMEINGVCVNDLLEDRINEIENIIIDKLCEI